MCSILEQPLEKSEVKTENSPLNENNVSITQDSKAQDKKKLAIYAALGLVGFIIFWKLCFSGPKKEEGKKVVKEEEVINIGIPIAGEINCVFNILNISQPTKLFGDEFKKLSNFDMYIDGKKVNFSKEYQFDSVKEHKLKIKLYDDINMDYMFKDIIDLISVDMNSHKKCKILSMKSTFENCIKLINFNIIGFDAERVKSMNKLFYNTSLYDFTLSSFNSKNLDDISYMFAYSPFKEISFYNFNTEKVTNMTHLFDNCSDLESIDLSTFDTNEVKDMSFMFSSCNGISSLDFSKFRTSKVSNMSNMFKDCNNLTKLDLNNFDTKKVTDMNNMFGNCKKLTSLDLNNFDTNNVEDMQEMFSHCSNLTSLNLGSFKTKNVKNMNKMFTYCKKI